MFRTSEQINEVATALAKAQGEFKPVPKTRPGKIEGISKSSGKPFSFSYKYADIADVLESVLPILSRNGLALIQPPVMDGAVLTVTTRILHGSGQWLECDYPVCSIQGDHQKMGGALTYARRYAACSMLGIAPDEDTDGVGADDPAPKGRTTPAPGTTRGQEDLPRTDYDQTPFDDFPGDAPSREEKEPAISTAAINIGRELRACKTMPMLVELWTSERIKAFYKAAHAVDRKSIEGAKDAQKAVLNDADLLAAG